MSTYGFRTLKCLQITLYHELGKLSKPNTSIDSANEPHFDTFLNELPRSKLRGRSSLQSLLIREVSFEE